jgi:hypothetical protein
MSDREDPFSILALVMSTPGYCGSMMRTADPVRNRQEGDDDAGLEDIPDAVESPHEPSEEPVNAPQENYPPPR